MRYIIPSASYTPPRELLKFATATSSGKPPILLPSNIIEETLSTTNLSKLSSLEPSWKDRISKMSPSPEAYNSLFKLQARQLCFNPGKVVALRRPHQGLLNSFYPGVTELLARRIEGISGCSNVSFKRKADPLSDPGGPCPKSPPKRNILSHVV